MACNFCDALLAGAVGPLHCQMTAENGTQFCTLCSVLREMLHASSRENKNWPGPARSTATTKPPAVVVSYTASSGIVHTATFFCQLLLQPSIVPLDAVQDVVSQPPRVCWLWLQQFRYPTAVSTVAIFASTCCTTYANLHSAAHQSLIRCINCSHAPCKVSRGIYWRSLYNKGHRGDDTTAGGAHCLLRQRPRLGHHGCSTAGPRPHTADVGPAATAYSMHPGSRWSVSVHPNGSLTEGRHWASDLLMCMWLNVSAVVPLPHGHLHFR